MFSRPRGLRHLLALIVESLAVGALTVPTSAAPAPRFETISCDLPDIAKITSRVRCGVVNMPRDHMHPDDPTYAFAVVVVRSGHQPALLDTQSPIISGDKRINSHLAWRRAEKT